MKPIWPNRHTQLWDLLNALLEGKRFTVVSAIDTLGIYALSQRCGDLKRLRWPVRDEWFETSHGARVKRYFL